MSTIRMRLRSVCAAIVLIAITIPQTAVAEDQPQWGQRYSRNLVSDETGLPDSFDPATGRNVKWVAPLGSQTYSTPIIARGKVLIGTNNDPSIDPRFKGDRGVLACFNEADGKPLWRLVVPKFSDDPFRDWRHIGITATATVEGDRVFLISNRCELLCLDLNGMSDGNDGPFQDEARFMALPDQPPVEIRPVDGDIIWRFDIPGELGVRQHDQASSSPLVYGPFVYACTSNGVDGTHKHLPKPNAPSLIVLDKATGRLVATDDGSLSKNIIHSMWSSPSLGIVNDRPLVFFGGGDGVCYAFDTIKSAPASGKAAALTTVWRFYCDPEAPKENPLRYQENRREGASNISGMPVFYNDRVYVTAGGDVWHGKTKAWLKCIDATGHGDITTRGHVWTYPLKRHCMSTPAVHQNLVYITDCGRTVHCVDADTGEPYWTHQTNGEIWASPLVVDGKVYVGTRRGDFWTFAAGKQKKVLNRVKLDSAIHATPTAANGVLYVATMTRLYAVAKTGP